jgi:hypothetical protein
MKKLVRGLVGCVAVFVGCANEVTIEEQSSTSTGGTSSGSSGSSGTGSSSTTGGMTTACVPVEDPPISPNPTCKELERLILDNPILEGDSDGDGLVEPGETATLTVTMKDVSGLGFNWYPGVVFESGDPAVGVQADTWFFAVLPCGEQPATATIKVSPDVKKGQTISLRARVDMMNGNCAGTSALDIPLKIQ